MGLTNGADKYSDGALAPSSPMLAPPLDFIKKYKEPGYKIDKTRITVLVAANADESDKRQLLVIHKWKKPRALKNIPVLPVQYEFNPSAWMTQFVFDAWIKKFNDD